MERELWARLYHLVMEVGQTLRLTDVTYQPHIIVLVFLWAALHDRPVSWPATRGTGPRPLCGARDSARPVDPQSAAPPGGHRDADAGPGAAGGARKETRNSSPSHRAPKPLPVGGASQAPHAHCGRGAGMWAKGYKLYAIWGGRPVPETYRVYPMNTSEIKLVKK